MNLHNDVRLDAAPRRYTLRGWSQTFQVFDRGGRFLGRIESSQRRGHKRVDLTVAANGRQLLGRDLDWLVDTMAEVR